MSAPESSQQKAPSVNLMRFAAFGAGLLAVAGGVTFYYASQMQHPQATGTAFRVNVGAQACEPNAITVPAGRTAFEIENSSDRVVEWEILSGVMVVAERENIAPGFRQTLTANLAPGTYEITCGLLSNPRGTLLVTPSEAYAAEAARPTLKAFIGPLSEYKVYLAMQGAALVDATTKLAGAIKAGKLEQARALYKEARTPYNRIEAVTDRIADLKNAIDPVADYLEKREQDPAFTGFHRIEYGLFTAGSTEGLAPFADKLVADVTALKQRLRETKLAPEDLAGNAGNLAARLAQQADKADPAELQANLAGLDKMVGLLKPVLASAAPDVASDVDAKFAATQAALDKLKGPDGSAKADAATRQGLAKALEDLAAALSHINAAVGLG
jgi:iron uptake system component EfeO